MTRQNLLVELFVEELPPRALQKLGDAFAGQLQRQLQALGLAAVDSVVTPYASPRRLAAHITAVAAQAADRQVSQKLMPVSVGLDASGNATPALLKKLQSLGADASVVAQLQRRLDGKTEALFHDSTLPGVSLTEGLQKALDEAIAKLPIPKVMSYQLEADCELPGWSSVQFVRPAHKLIALYADQTLAVTALGLKAGNTTLGHRFEAAVTPVPIAHADDYAETLFTQGAVIASFGQRRAEIARQLAAAAAQVGGGCQAIDDAALLDEVTALVERPKVLICAFDPEFLEVPQECLILTMKANQKYFPLLDAAGRLSHRFLVVSNIDPVDPSAVIGGNERVVRPRLADAKFFFDQDRKKTLESRVDGLYRVVYHSQLGSQGERMARVCAIASAIGAQLGGARLQQAADSAARLAKTDLLTGMVGEFPELQGIMGGYYARHDGLSEDIAFAIEDHYRPRFAGDVLPRNEVGVVVALADKLETLVGMFGSGNLPTGDKDPFALRRHALGVIRLLIEKDLPIEIGNLVSTAWAVLNDEQIQRSAFDKQQAIEHGAKTGRAVVQASAFGRRTFEPDTETRVLDFIYERLAGALREQGYSAQEVDAVLALRPPRLSQVARRLLAVRAFAALPESAALAAANKRIANLLKKAPEVDPHVNPLLLHESAEQALFAALQQSLPRANALFEAGDYTASLQTLAALRAPVDAFFDDVMVNAEQPDVRLNRQGLLKMLQQAMNRVADLSRLAT